MIILTSIISTLFLFAGLHLSVKTLKVEKDSTEYYRVSLGALLSFFASTFLLTIGRPALMAQGLYWFPVIIAFYAITYILFNFKKIVGEPDNPQPTK